MLAQSVTSARTRRLAVALAAAPLAFGLVACGSESDDDRDDTSSAVVSPSASTPSSAGSSAGSTDDTDDDVDDTSSGTPAPAEGIAGGDVLTAAATAAAAVDGGTLFSIDRDNGGWEASVVAADGSESDVDVSIDGATVTRGPVADADGDDGDDAAERERLLGASVTYEDAVAAALAQVPDSTVTGLDLDEDNGTAVWEVQLDEDTADERTVTIDATTGAVLRTERDD